jgi:hypothetical protein
VVTLGNVDILVCSGPEVDPYFSIMMSDPPVGWWRGWFFLRNDADAPLPTFMTGRLVPHPNWEYGVARAGLHRLQPLLEIVWGLLQRELTNAKILWIFFSCEVQPLHQREATVRMSPGQVVPSTPSPWRQLA